MKKTVRSWILRSPIGAALRPLALVAAFASALPALSMAADDTSWLKRWDGVTLVLSSHAGPTTEAARVLAKKFEELTGAKVDVRGDPWQTLLANHLADFAAGTASYDVLTWPYTWTGNYIEGGLVDPLDPMFANPELADPAFDMADIPVAAQEVYGHYRGASSPNAEALWSLPYKFDIYMAMYRADLFEQAGIVDDQGKAKPPATYDELVADAKILKDKFPDMDPIALPLAVDDPMVSTFLPIFASYGGNGTIPWYDSNLFPQIQSEPAKKALGILQQLMPYMPKDALDMDYDRVNQQFAQGRAAFAMNWNAYLPVILDPTSSTVVDTARFTTTPGGPAGNVSGLGGWVMGVSSISKNKEAAFQLIEWLGGRGRGVDFVMNGGSVARYSVADDPEVQKKFSFYPLLMKAFDKFAARGMDRSWTEVQRTIGVGLNGALLNGNADAALLETARQMYDQVQKAGYTPEKTGPRP